MKVMTYLEELEDIVDSSASLPFTNKVLVDKDAILEILKEIRISLPDDIKQGSWIKEERNKIINEAHEEANRILEDTEAHAEHMADRDEIVKRANKKAEEMIEEATVQSEKIRLSAIEYTDGILSRIEKTLNDHLEILSTNRAELSDELSELNIPNINLLSSQDESDDRMNY